MTRLTIDSVQSEIGQKIAKKFDVKNTDLQYLLGKFRGKLPRGFEDDLSYLFDAQMRVQHPKRRMQVDQNKLKALRRRCFAKLDKIDLVRDKSRARSLWLAEFAARFLLYVGAMISLLYLLDFI